LDPDTPDHHGLKYIDKGKALRYFKAIKGGEKSPGSMRIPMSLIVSSIAAIL
jgi:hypothetical protein